MNTPFPAEFPNASNASRILRAPMPASFPQFATSSQPPQLLYPFMMMRPQLQPPQLQQLPTLHPGIPMHSFPTHNCTLLSFQPPFFPVNQVPVVPLPQNGQSQMLSAPSATPTSRITHNTSLNASLLSASTSFNDSVRFNPLAGRGRSRDHSLLIDQTTSSSDRSFQKSFVDPQEMANNNELILYCMYELCRKQLTEQELVAKVSKSRRFRKFGFQNIPAAVAIILNSFPCFTARTVILRTCPNDLHPITKTIWKSDNRFPRSRGDKLNVSTSDIPERNTSCGEVLSVLGDIESLNLDEKHHSTSQDGFN